MSEMKCPFCQQELVYLADNFYCPNCYSNKHKHYAASPELWQELVDTKKKLDIAVDALKKYTDASGNWWYGYEFQGHYEDYAGEYADKAIEEITALEQKDVK